MKALSARLEEIGFMMVCPPVGAAGHRVPHVLVAPFMEVQPVAVAVDFDYSDYGGVIVVTSFTSQQMLFIHHGSSWWHWVPGKYENAPLTHCRPESVQLIHEVMGSADKPNFGRIHPPALFVDTQPKVSLDVKEWNTNIILGGRVLVLSRKDGRRVRKESHGGGASEDDKVFVAYFTESKRAYLVVGSCKSNIGMNTVGSFLEELK